MKFLVSADLGQAVGYTAIAVSDRILKPAGEAETDRVFDNVRGHFRGSYPADRWSSGNTSDAWRGLPCSRPIPNSRTPRKASEALGRRRARTVP
jgi:hypothetical protein